MTTDETASSLVTCDHCARTPCLTPTLCGKSRAMEARSWHQRGSETVRGPHGDAWRTKIVTAADLETMTFEPVRLVLPQYIAEGVSLLIGRPKIGKSWFALDLAVAWASDCCVFGSLKPLHGDVLYLALEDSKRRLQRRLGKLLSPFSPTWPERLSLIQMGDWRRADQGGLDDIEAWCESVVNPIGVVIDTLERFRKPASGKQQLYAFDTEAIASLQRIAIKYGIAVVLLHHDRKAEADDPFDTVSGSLGLTGAADTILILKRQPDGNVVLHARGRDIEESNTAFQFDKATCRWTIQGEAAAVLRSAERRRVISTIAEASGPLSVGEIMTQLELTRNAADVLLGRMARDGEIQRVGRGRYCLSVQSLNPRQIGQKERSEEQDIRIAEQTGNLSNLSHLSENDLAPGGEGGAVSAALELLSRLEAIGATIEPTGDRLRIRAGLKPVPASVIRRVRQAKLEVLAALQGLTARSVCLVAITDGEPGLEQPCAARRGRIQELDGAFLYFCVECGRFGAFGYGVQLRKGRLGRWYCGEHRPEAVSG